MVTKQEIINSFAKAAKENKKLFICLSEDNTKILDAETNEYICSIDTYVQYIKEKLHCNFECIYHEPISLSTIYKCKDCGAIIFTGDDERYDPNLKCPVCTDYNHLDFWSKEEIENDPDKQKQLQLYIDMQKEMNEESKRIKARGGLYDWQVFKKSWYGKKHSVNIELQNWGHKYSNTPWYKASINLKIYIGKKDTDTDIGYIINKFIDIPLSPYAFYIKFVYPYSKKCHPSLRKYYPWQKKP